MGILISFFLRFLLAPILVLIGVFVMNTIAKGKEAFRFKKLIIFVLILAIILALPSLLGLLRYEFIWGGLILTIGIYIILGASFLLFARSDAFKNIGIYKNKWHVLLAVTIAVILGGWIYYLVFNWLNKLTYSAWAMCSVLWFYLPILYNYSRVSFVKIPAPFYELWRVEFNNNDDEYWNNVDTFRLMQVNVKIKRNQDAKNHSSFSVKLPDDISIGRWFNRFIEDQNIRFPNQTIALSDDNGEEYGWIFYTQRWLPIPLFIRMIDFNNDVLKNRIKNKGVLYVKRVSQSENKLESKE